MKKLLLSLLLVAVSASAQIVNPGASGPGARPSSFTNHGVLIGQGAANVAATTAGTSGLCLLSGGSTADPNWGSCSGGAAGTVTSVSVVSANGLAGSVATATTTPAITLSTSISGILKGNGTAISAAASGTDYAPATSGSAILKGNGAGGFTNTVSGTDYAPATSGSSILSGNGSGGFSNVVVGTGLSFSGGTLNNTGVTGLTIINGYINGFTLSNDGTTPLTKLDVAAGFAADSTNAAMISGTAFVKTVSGAWVSGSGNNGMGTGLTVANNTWYHVFAIINAGAYDVYFDTSPTAANKPASTTAFRYVGSFRTNGSAQIIAFAQSGNEFYWVTAVNDIPTVAGNTPTLGTLTVPTGFSVYPLMVVETNGQVSVWSPSIGATSPNPAHGYASTFVQTRFPATNTSAQIYYSGSAGNIYTLGYVNPKVAPNN